MFKIVNKKEYDELKEKCESLEKSFSEIWSDVASKNSYGYIGLSFLKHSQETKKQDIITKLSRLSNFYQKVASQDMKHRSGEESRIYYKEEQQFMQDKIDEQANYIEKMQRAYYAAEKAMK